MGIGAKLARGCTSGQALTGGAVLNLGSWAFICAFVLPAGCAKKAVMKDEAAVEKESAAEKKASAEAAPAKAPEAQKVDERVAIS